MAHINLLPWREELRKQQKKQFATAAALSVVLAGLIVLYAHMHISGLIDEQNQRNDFLNKEIAELDSKIKQIKELEATRIKLQARINIIQQLQRSRPQIVHLFDQLARTLPDGVYLTSIEQKGDELTLHGVAQSNARVSSYMRNIADSGWMADPKLDVIQATGDKDKKARDSDFTLKVRQASGTDSESLSQTAQAQGEAKP